MYIYIYVYLYVCKYFLKSRFIYGIYMPVYTCIYILSLYAEKKGFLHFFYLLTLWSSILLKSNGVRKLCETLSYHQASFHHSLLDVWCSSPWRRKLLYMHDATWEIHAIRRALHAQIFTSVAKIRFFFKRKCIKNLSPFFFAWFGKSFLTKSNKNHRIWTQTNVLFLPCSE